MEMKGNERNKPIKIEPYKTLLDTEQVLRYLFGLNLLIFIKPFETKLEKTEDPIDGVFYKLGMTMHNTSIYCLPSGMDKFARKIRFLAREWQQFFIQLYLLRCPRGVHDRFTYLKNSSTGYPNFMLGDTSIGTSVVCRECKRFLDHRTDCGKYARRKAEYVGDSSAILSQFKKDVAAGRLTKLPPKLERFYAVLKSL